MLTKIDSSRLLSVSRGKLWARWRRIANLIHANSDNEVANLLLHARWTSQDGRLVGFSCPFRTSWTRGINILSYFHAGYLGILSIMNFLYFPLRVFFSVSLLHSFMASFFFSFFFFSFISLPSFFSFHLLPFFFSSYLFLSILCYLPFRLSCLPFPSFYRLSLSPLFLPFLSCLSSLSVTPLLFLPSIRPLFLLLFYHIFTFLLKLGVV